MWLFRILGRCSAPDTNMIEKLYLLTSEFIRNLCWRPEWEAEKHTSTQQWDGWTTLSCAQIWIYQGVRETFRVTPNCVWWYSGQFRSWQVQKCRCFDNRIGWNESDILFYLSPWNQGDVHGPCTWSEGYWTGYYVPSWYCIIDALGYLYEIIKKIVYYIYTISRKIYVIDI